MPNRTITVSPLLIFCGAMVHLLTSLAIVCGLLTLVAIQLHQIKLAFFLMGVALAIDAVDGTLARYFHVKTTLPKIDGALLDNIADYINYVMTPCYLLVSSPDLMPSYWSFVLSGGILVASAYQFCQTDAKTEDCFFTGFPSYWNFVVFYMYSFQTSVTTNIIATIILIALVFIPVKYIYLSRMSHVTHNVLFKWFILAVSLLYGAVNLWMLYAFPHYPVFCYYFVITYMCFYFSLSFYRTLKPLSG